MIYANAYDARETLERWNRYAFAHGCVSWVASDLSGLFVVTEWNRRRADGSIDSGSSVAHISSYRDLRLELGY